MSKALSRSTRYVLEMLEDDIKGDAAVLFFARRSGAFLVSIDYIRRHGSSVCVKTWKG